MKRSKFNLSHQKLATADMGELVPVSLMEMLPGDSVQLSTSALVRLMPLASPVYHQAVVRVHHWFVPTRLLWDDWEDFITGGQDGEGAASAYPYIQAHATNGFTQGELADYFGIPPGSSGADLQVSALPFRAYNLIYNEFYRDQDLVTALTVPTSGGQDTTSPLVLQNCGWEKDYFTSARPWAQRGPEVTLPLGLSAPVRIESTNATIDGKLHYPYRTGGGAGEQGYANVAETFVANFPAGAGGTLAADLSEATAASITDLRLANALQRYQERLARFGSRYSEYLRSMGIRPQDARLQRPEYLGGGKQVISFSEVLQTAPDADATTSEGVADLKGHGISAVRSRRSRYFVQEHGYVLTLMSVRPKAIYGNTLPRMWSRRDKEDYFQPELQFVGQQPVYRREIYAQSDANGGSTVFGYQDRYDEYRRADSTISADFRSTLNFWHMARIFGSAPTLNQAFVECEPTKRVFMDQTSDCLQIVAANNVRARRILAADGTPRIL